MVSRGNNSLTYDANGNLLSEIGPKYQMEYAYSADNRMISATTPDDDDEIEVLYGYDALRRRINRIENEFEGRKRELDDSEEDGYHYAGLSMQLQVRSYLEDRFDDDDAELQDYFYAAGSLVSFTEDWDTYYAHTDYQGSMIGVIEEDDVEEKYLYDVFGTPVKGEFDDENLLGYNGKVYDRVTQMYNYGFRDYSSMHGWFSTVDPVRDGHDWYAYVGMEPVNRVDLWGLEESDSSSDNQVYALSGRHVTSDYGYRVDPITGEKDSLHPGVDTRVIPNNSPALIGGTVIHAGPAGNAGNTVTIKNNIGGQNFYSSNQHLDEILVEVGDTVSASDIVGIPGSTGKSDGPHNHNDLFTYQGETELVKDMIGTGVESHSFPDAFGQRTTFNPKQAIEYFIENEVRF